MRNLAISLKRTGFALLATLFTIVVSVANLSIFSLGSAGAAQVTARSLVLSSSLAGTVGSTTPANSETNGASTTHTFKFTAPSATVVKSIKFQYCTTAIGTCTMPTGMTADLAVASTQTKDTGAGNTALPFAIDATATTAGVIAVKDATGTALSTGNGVVSMAFTTITNPDVDAVNNAFYVHILTYSDVAWTTPVDDGTVASAITEAINITARVKETLGFSVTGSKAGVTDPSTNCAPLSGSGAINLGDTTDHALSFTTAYVNHSYFRVFTNAGSGAVVQYKGDTLKKGGTVPITALLNVSPTASATGTEQFGLAIDQDDTNVTADNSDVTAQPSAAYITDAADWGDPGHLTIAAGYDDGANNNYKYNATVLTPLASSTGYITCDTGMVKYVANISPLTPAGTYTTTVVYYAVPTY